MVEPERARREVARGLLFDDARRMALIRWRDPLTGHEFMEPPGGGREPDESLEDAVRREIGEEVGLTQVDVVGFVTTIDHFFTFAGEDYDCTEHYFLCRLSGNERAPVRREDIEHAGIIGTEWMTVAELRALPPGGLEPPRLLEMLESLELEDST